MAFDFQAYRNPYVSTIADLLSRGEDAKAKALVDTASAQARAAEIRGQAYGGAIDSVGKMVAGLPAQMQANKRQALNDKVTMASLTQTNLENEGLAGAANDKILVDRAGSVYGAVEPDFTGPLPEGSPTPTREQALANLPLRLRQQVEKSYAELDASAQGIAASKSAQAQNEAQTKAFADKSLDSQRVYVSDLANQLRAYNGSMASIQMAYDHAKGANLDPETMAQVDAMYAQLNAAPTDAERAQIVNTVKLHPSTIAANLAALKETNDAAQAAATLEATNAQRRASNQLQQNALADRKDARDLVRQDKEAKDLAAREAKSQKGESGPVLLRAALSSLRDIDGGLTQRSGVTGMLAGVKQGIMGAANLDVVPGVYNGLAAAIPIRLAKASGEQGNLALGEQAVWRPITPKASDPYNIRQAKYAAIEAFVTAVESGKQTRDASGVIVSNSQLADNLLITLTRLNDGAVVPNAL